MIEKAIYAKLSGDAAVSALVAARVYPNLAPQDTTLPYIVFKEVTSQVYQSKTPGNDGLSRSDVEVHCVAEEQLDANTLAEEVREALHGFSGTVGGVAVTSIISQPRINAAELPPDLRDRVRPRVINTYTAKYRHTGANN